MKASTKTIVTAMEVVAVKCSSATHLGKMKRFFRIPSTAKGNTNDADSAANVFETIV